MELWLKVDPVTLQFLISAVIVAAGVIAFLKFTPRKDKANETSEH